MTPQKLLLALIVSIPLLSSCDSGKEPPSQARTEKPATLLATSADEITLVTGCSSCHGSDGIGKNPNIPFIAGQSEKYLEFTMRSYLVMDRNHDVMRQAVFDLDVSDRQELAKHFANLKTPWKKGKDSQKLKKQSPAPHAIRAGQALSKPCASCHGQDGNSITTGVPSLAGLQPVYFVSALKAYLTEIRRGASIMKNFKLSLSNQDISNLAAYYSVQQRQRSPLSAKSEKIVPSDALAPRCMGCHGVNGNSTHPAIPSLAGQNATYLIKAMKAYRDGNRHNKMMLDVAHGLSDDDIKRNAAYFTRRTPAKIKQTRSTKNTPVTFDPLGDGAKLAASCNSCHGNKGNNPKRVTPRLAGLHNTYLRNAITAYRSGERKHPMMQMLTQYLSKTDIEKLSLYYANQTPEKNNRNSKTGNAKAGQKLASACSGCHGEKGNSQTPITPSLAGQDASYLIMAINSYKESGSRNHKDMKNIIQELDKKSIRNLAQHYVQQTLKGDTPRTPEAPEDLAKKCGHCHGENGSKPDPEKPRIAGQRQSYLAKALTAYKNGDRINSIMQAMSAELWDVEIEAIATHYASQ